ncbi:hypothetical protein TRVA0_053S01068 [Trichomonascus vanleenenianus]|uniref:stromal membrane-associated family protein n=1 Tax=Trichomonascus vanleenenianus TaxID=2268995 RepID=UPI003ECAF55B
MSSYSNRYSRGNAVQAQRKATSDKNQQTLRKLLTDPVNKHCADCKTAGHPRWASWNLGIFLCIRCSGIHRGMGTHISKVRSIDLDTWNDEHTENMVKWGNKRANLYWEHKLPDNYVPDDSKIQNFIRTKYDLKRWVMPGPLPDPATLEGQQEAQLKEESTPLAEVKRKLSTRTAQKQVPTASPSSLIPDLLGGDDAPPKPISKAPPTQATTSKREQAAPPPPPPPQKQPTDSLLGLDFGAPPSAGVGQQKPRSSISSVSSSGSGVSRPDLKKSILSLYANSKPPVQPQTFRQPSVSGVDTLVNSTNSMSLGGGSSSNADLLGGLSFASPSANSTSFFDSTTTAPPPTTTTNNAATKQNDAFGSLMSGNNASAWASSHNGTTASRSNSTALPSVTHPSNNDDWDSFVSAPAQHAHPTTNSVMTGFNADDDVFNNVWK